jgi:hypothetical protein
MINSHRGVLRVGTADIRDVEDTPGGIAEQGLGLLPGGLCLRGGRQATLQSLQAQENKYGFSLTDTNRIPVEN